LQNVVQAACVVARFAEPDECSVVVQMSPAVPGPLMR